MKNPRIKIVDPGHAYTVLTPGGSTYTIPFMKMSKDHRHDGITNEDLIEILIDRIEFLNEGKLRCTENSRAIEYLKGALGALEQRTADRIARGVEGTNKK